MAFRLLQMQAWISWIVFNQLFSDALHQRPRCSAGEADLELGQIKGFHQPKDGTWKRLYHMTGWKLQPLEFGYPQVVLEYEYDDTHIC